MSTVQEAVQSFMKRKGWSARELAERSGVNQMTISALLEEGSLPRKAEHREHLREVLNLDSESWAAMLMKSSGLPLIPDEQAPLQVLIAHHMFLQGLTERSLSALCGVPYGTILGMVRKGAIPRGNSLNRISDALQLEPSLVAAALQRSGGNPVSMPPQAVEQQISEGLAPLVARRIRSLGLSMGTYSERIGVGYLSFSRFMESGQAPEDQATLKALREDLELDEVAFQEAIAHSGSTAKPGMVNARKGEAPPDASQLQQALVRYMNSRKMTIKALSEQLDLSQITVSRLVKQGVRPSRARTHQRLRQLLGLSEAAYGDLLAGHLNPSHFESPSVALVANTAPTRSVRVARYATLPEDEDEEFVSTDSLVAGRNLSDQYIMHQIARLNTVQRAQLVDFLQRLNAAASSESRS